MRINSLAVKNVLFRSGVSLNTGFFNKGRQLAILRYHSIQTNGTNDYVSSNIALPVDCFERQIRYLTKTYHVISLDEVADCFVNQRAFPDNALAITFDDGYRDNYTAYKILFKYGVSGTFYIVAGCIDSGEPLWLFEVIYLIKNTGRQTLALTVSDERLTLPIRSVAEKRAAIRKVTEIIKSNNRDLRESIRAQLRTGLSDVTGLERRASEIMLTWEQLREMSANGMSIGGHTMTHLNLPNADPGDAFREIADCKNLLESKLQKPVLHFSYPNGGKYAYYNQSVIDMVKRAGFRTSTTSNNGMACLTADRFELRRIRVTPNLSEIYYQIQWEPLVERLLSCSLRFNE